MPHRTINAPGITRQTFKKGRKNRAIIILPGQPFPSRVPLWDGLLYKPRGLAPFHPQSRKPKRCTRDLFRRKGPHKLAQRFTPPADYLGIGSLHLSHGERSQMPCVSPPGPPLPGSSATPSEQPYRLFPPPAEGERGKKKKKAGRRLRRSRAWEARGGSRSKAARDSASHEFSESGSGARSGRGVGVCCASG